MSRQVYYLLSFCLDIFYFEIFIPQLSYIIIESVYILERTLTCLKLVFIVYFFSGKRIIVYVFCLSRKRNKNEHFRQISRPAVLAVLQNKWMNSSINSHI